MVSAFMRSCIGLIDRWLRYSSVLSLSRGSFFPVVSCLRRKTDNFPLTWCRTLSPPSQLSLSSGVAGSGLTSVPPPSSSSPNDEDCLSSEERALPRRRIILLYCTTRPLPRGGGGRAKRRVRPDNGRLSFRKCLFLRPAAVLLFTRLRPTPLLAMAAGCWLLPPPAGCRRSMPCRRCAFAAAVVFHVSINTSTWKCCGVSGYILSLSIVVSGMISLSSPCYYNT